MKATLLHNPDQKKNIICLSVLAFMALFLGLYFWINNRPAPVKAYSTELSESTALESRMLFGGDIYWGRRMHDWSQQSDLKEAYPFSRLDEFQRDSYDAWIANLECPAIPGVKQPIGFEPKLWEFNCDTDYLPEAAKWFDVFSLANNHTQNQEREKGLAVTREQLDKHGVQHFGNFTPHVTRDVCEVISLPVRVRLDGKQQQAQLPVAMCGYGGVYYTITDKEMAVMQKYADYMPVIAMPHMGQEYQPTADEERRDLYQRMIDNGADMVIGNHPHWVQPAEAYKGKLIVYSMGNLIFDQQFSDEVMRSAAIDVTLSLPQEIAEQDQVRQWLELGKSCNTFDDDCLAMAKKRQLQRLSLTFNYDIVGVDTSNQITKRANFKVYNSILERLDWANVKPKLNGSAQ